MTTIAELSVAAVVRTEGATKGAREFKNEVRGMSSTALAASAGVAALGTAAVTAGYMIYSLVEGQGKVADALDHTSQKTGVAVENLSRYRYGAKLAADVTAGGLDAALERMNTNTGLAARGLGKAGKAIEELHLNAKQLSTLDTDTRLGVIADAIKHVSSAADQTRLTEKIFGDGNLMVWLKDGAAGLNKLSQECDLAGATLGTLANKKLADADDSLDRMHESLGGAKHALASVFAPAVKMVADELTETIALMKDAHYIEHAQEEAWKREAAAVTAAAAARKKYNEVKWAKGGSAANTVDLSYRKRELEQMANDRKGLQEKILDTRTGNRTFGMSDLEVAKDHLAHAMTDKALEAQLIKELEIREKLTKAHDAAAAAKEKDNQLTERATSLVEENKTELEHLHDRLVDIQELHKAGKLTEDQAMRAAQNARDGFRPTDEAAPARHPALAAIKFGSVEAVRAIHESKEAGEMKQLSVKQLKELEKANDLARETKNILQDVVPVADW